MSMCVFLHTSLSREASRWRERSDIRKLRVVSTIGCGPGFSGAYCTLRITSRTEFLHKRKHTSRARQSYHYKIQNLTYKQTCYTHTYILYTPSSNIQHTNYPVLSKYMSVKRKCCTSYESSPLQIWHRKLWSQSLHRMPEGGKVMIY